MATVYAANQIACRSTPCQVLILQTLFYWVNNLYCWDIGISSLDYALWSQHGAEINNQ